MTPTTDQLKDLLAKVTPAPWNVTTPVDDEPEFRVIQHGNYGHSDCGRYLHTSGQTSEADATLIALAPTLAAEVVKLRGDVDMWRAELKSLLDAYEKPDDRMCCDGQMCGCMGATNHQYAEYMARQALDASSAK